MSLTNITLSENEVLNCLRSIDVLKASGPDAIPGRLLKAVATEITPSLTRVFNLSLSSGKVPSAWKIALITPILKYGDPHVVTNYRPISLLSILSKVLERCIYSHCYEFMQHKLSFYQHGFVQGRNCTTQLVWFYHKILEALDNGHEVDAIYLDFSKAFDRISHCLRIDKLKRHCLGGVLHDWFVDYITLRSQKVVIDGVCSDLLNVTSGVRQGSILGPLRFVLYINDLPECIHKPMDIALFADDSKVSQTIGSSNDGVNLQCNLNRLHSWSSEWHMDFNITKCKSMRITRKKTPKLETDYSIDNNLLKCITSIH